MPIVSIKKGILGSGILKKAAGSAPNSYTPKKLENFLKKGKTSTPYGSITYKKLFEKNQTMDKKKFKEMYESGQKEGVFGKFYSAEDQFNKAVREEKRMTLEEIKKTKESQKIQAKNKQPETVKTKDEKASKIAASRVETKRAELGREMRFGKKAIGKLGEVIEGQSKFRETWGRSSDLLKSRGGGGTAAEGRAVGLFNKAMQEEEDEKSSPKGSKGGQKSGGNTTTNQKAIGPKMVGLRGLASIGELSSQSEISNNENIPTGGIRVKELENKPPASQPEISPAPRSASAPEDPDELNI